MSARTAGLRLDEMTWEQVRDLDRSRAIAVLPVGAIEAHGPHLPLNTDVIIAEAMARAGAERLRGAKLDPVILPSLAYTAASFAASFPGTLSMPPESVAEMITAIGHGLARHGWRWLAIANSHLDPVHLGSIRNALDRLATAAVDLTVIFPDISRKPWALRLTDEFKSGACHAGQYETSIVMAERPDLVNEATRKQLADNPASLSTAIRDGKTSFEAAGGPLAYFGYPATATAAEGHDTIAVLGTILSDAVLAVMNPDEPAKANA